MVFAPSFQSGISELALSSHVLSSFGAHLGQELLEHVDEWGVSANGCIPQLVGNQYGEIPIFDMMLTGATPMDWKPPKILLETTQHLW